MNIAGLIAHNLFSFVIILSIIVFIHEFGHYFVARLCGVRVEEFSIGFGKELFGRNDKHGTRWKFCLLPFGGYVKMFGDSNPASVADGEQVKKMSAAERKVSLYFQNVYKRIAVVSAGPIANFLLCILLLTVIFDVRGLTRTLPIVDKIEEVSAAKSAGILVGDEILKINDQEITDFDQIKEIVVQNGEREMQINILRNGQIINVSLTPKISLSKNIFGEEQKMPLIGIGASQFEYQKLSLSQAFIKANVETFRLCGVILKSIWQLVTGQRSLKELGGPVKIAEYSGKSMSGGLMMVLWFMAMISVNLGVANLLPIPALDGGHLFYYIIEVILGKPLPEKVQMIGFQMGFAVLASLMIFTTFNDIFQIFKH